MFLVNLEDINVRYNTDKKNNPTAFKVTLNEDVTPQYMEAFKKIVEYYKGNVGVDKEKYPHFVNIADVNEFKVYIFADFDVDSEEITGYVHTENDTYTLYISYNDGLDLVSLERFSLQIPDDKVKLCETEQLIKQLIGTQLTMFLNGIQMLDFQ